VKGADPVERRPAVLRGLDFVSPGRQERAEALQRVRIVVRKKDRLLVRDRAPGERVV
jgi:cob(I)alamin adenosyltransferase